MKRCRRWQARWQTSGGGGGGGGSGHLLDLVWRRDGRQAGRRQLILERRHLRLRRPLLHHLQPARHQQRAHLRAATPGKWSAVEAGGPRCAATRTGRWRWRRRPADEMAGFRAVRKHDWEDWRAATAVRRPKDAEPPTCRRQTRWLGRVARVGTSCCTLCAGSAEL